MDWHRSSRHLTLFHPAQGPDAVREERRKASAASDQPPTDRRRVIEKRAAIDGDLCPAQRDRYAHLAGGVREPHRLGIGRPDRWALLDHAPAVCLGLVTGRRNLSPSLMDGFRRPCGVEKRQMTTGAMPIRVWASGHLGKSSICPNYPCLYRRVGSHRGLDRGWHRLSRWIALPPLAFAPPGHEPGPDAVDEEGMKVSAAHDQPQTGRRRLPAGARSDWWRPMSSPRGSRTPSVRSA